MSTEFVCSVCGKTFDVKLSDHGDVCQDCELSELGICNFCGSNPASGYTSRIPPHETVYACDVCFEYEKTGFDGF